LIQYPDDSITIIPDATKTGLDFGSIPINIGLSARKDDFHAGLQHFSKRGAKERPRIKRIKTSLKAGAVPHRVVR
jgi:hypothetical protein